MTHRTREEPREVVLRHHLAIFWKHATVGTLIPHATLEWMRRHNPAEESNHGSNETMDTMDEAG